MDDPGVLRLERCDPAKNMLRFYALQVAPNLFGEWSLLRVWGRIGRQGQMRTEWFKTKREAEDALRALERAKRKRGYREKRTFPYRERFQYEELPNLLRHNGKNNIKAALYDNALSLDRLLAYNGI